MKNKIISGVKYYRWKTDFPFISSFDLKLSVLEENAVASYMKKHDMPVIAYKGGFFLSEKTDTESFKREIAKDTLNLYMMSISLPEDCFIAPKSGFEYIKKNLLSGWGFRFKRNDSYFDKILSKNREYLISHQSIVSGDDLDTKKNLQELVNSSNWSILEDPITMFGDRNFKLLEEVFRDSSDVNDFLLEFIADEHNSLQSCAKMMLLTTKIKTRLIIDYKKDPDEVKKAFCIALNNVNNDFFRNINISSNFKEKAKIMDVPKSIGTMLLVSSFLSENSNMTSSSLGLMENDVDNLFNILIGTNSINEGFFDNFNASDDLITKNVLSKTKEDLYKRLYIFLEKFKELDLSTKKYRDTLLDKIKFKTDNPLLRPIEIKESSYSFVLIDKNMADTWSNWYVDFEKNRLNLSEDDRAVLLRDSNRMEKLSLEQILNSFSTKLSDLPFVGIKLNRVVQGSYVLLAKNDLAFDDVVGYAEESLYKIRSNLVSHYNYEKKPSTPLSELINTELYRFNPVDFAIAVNNKKMINGIWDNTYDGDKIEEDKNFGEYKI